MRLLGRGLGQRCLVLGPAEHEAENITWAWWAGGDIHLRVHHWESGNACQAQPAFSADFGGAGVSWAKAASGGPWQHRGGREHFHSTPGSSGKALLGLSGTWVSRQCGPRVSLRSNRAVVLLLGLVRKHSELDRDVLAGICEWGERRTMQRLEAKCFQ